ncbi:MAG: hypothetical protein LUG16_03290 [Candidatus Gastranaerophilales bacterium]|nr:hypothetical protein [Candidatus Gastranaerophilales bacterium]
MKFFEHINNVNRAVILLGRNISQFNRQENEILSVLKEKLKVEEHRIEDLYIIIYKIKNDTVYIMRILSAYQDICALL